MPPASAVPNWAIWETRMPTSAAESVPALLMPPVKVGPVTLIAVAVEMILLALSTTMPRVVARMVPVSTIAPVMVLPAMLMPVAPDDGAGIADIAGESRNVADIDTERFVCRRDWWPPRSCRNW